MKNQINFVIKNTFFLKSLISSQIVVPSLIIWHNYDVNLQLYTNSRPIRKTVMKKKHHRETSILKYHDTWPSVTNRNIELSGYHTSVLAAFLTKNVRRRPITWRLYLSNMAANKLCSFWRRPSLNLYRTGKLFIVVVLLEKEMVYTINGFSVIADKWYIFLLIRFWKGLTNFQRWESTNASQSKEVPKQSWKFLVKECFFSENVKCK